MDLIFLGASPSVPCVARWGRVRTSLSTVGCLPFLILEKVFVWRRVVGHAPFVARATQAEYILGCIPASS